MVKTCSFPETNTVTISTVMDKGLTKIQVYAKRTFKRSLVGELQSPLETLGTFVGEADESMISSCSW
jgi:hypothetical protein